MSSVLDYEKINNNNNITNHQNSVLKLPFYAGKGKLNNVTDAWKAKRILKTLQNINILDTNNLNADKIIAFANIIRQVRKNRIFDYRQDMITDISTLDNWLKNENVLNSSSISYVANLIDMYKYGTQSRRLHGNRIMVGMSPYLNNSYYWENKSKSTNYYSGYIFIAYDQFNAISDNIQLNILTNISTGLSNLFDDSVYSHRANGFFTAGSVLLSFEYYPNSRTSFVSKLNTNLIINEMKMYNSKSKTAISYRLQFIQNINYYISSRTFLTFEFETYYSHGEDKSYLRLVDGFSIFYHSTQSYSLPPNGNLLRFSSSFSIKHILF